MSSPVKKNKTTTAAKSKLAKSRKSVVKVVIHLFCSFNNSIISLTDTEGNVIASSSAGACGFKSAKKATAFAIQVIIKRIFESIDKYKVQNIACVIVTGIGSQVEQGINTILLESKKRNINVIKIVDDTPIAHNGVRPRKKRKT